MPSVRIAWVFVLERQNCCKISKFQNCKIAKLHFFEAPNGREYIAPNPKTRDRSAYHQPNDEYHEDWDVSGSLQSIDLHFSVGYQIANADKRPEWNSDSEYRRGQ